MVAASTTTRYDAIRRQIRDGDVGLLRNGGVIARISGKQTHAFKCKWNRDTHGAPSSLMVAESREWVGCRMIALRQIVADYPGRVDIYRPTCSAEVAWTSAELVARQAGHKYGWGTIGRLTLEHMIGARLLFGPTLDENDKLQSGWYTSKVCSQIIANADRMAGKPNNWDPFPGVPDCRVEPMFFAHTPAYDLFCEGLVL